MPNAIVSIGRNIKGTPMSDAEWTVFKAVTRNLVYQYCPNIYFIGEGKGYYENTTEDSFTLVGGLCEEPDMDSFKKELAELAKNFEQDCIALTVADPTFVSAA